MSKRTERNNRGPVRTGPSESSLQMLFILNQLVKKVMYEGTVPAAVIAKRRAKGKVARRSRRANRNG